MHQLSTNTFSCEIITTQLLALKVIGGCTASRFYVQVLKLTRSFKVGDLSVERKLLESVHSL